MDEEIIASGEPWECSREDIIKLIQNKVDFSSWKGDDHTRGVYFKDGYGCTLNKIMAIRVRHHCEDDFPLRDDLFYSFDALQRMNEDDAAEITSEVYPFENMKAKPKKHFLLFDKEKIETSEIDKMFEFAPISGTFKARPQSLIKVLDQINNKRDRERSMATLKVEGGTLHLGVYRPQSGYPILLAEGISPCEVVSPAEDGLKMSSTVNAHTLLYLLEIFNPFYSVTFLFGRDRMMITGDNGDETPNVEVVVSRLKTA